MTQSFSTDLRALRCSSTHRSTADTRHNAPTVRPARPSGLTARQMQVLKLVADGLENKQIAAALGLQNRTVESHVAAVIAAIGAANRTAAAVTAVRRGWV
jgi:DNA-binding NarL/FixJ family response regulator